eukprot:364581-Chlamydomonas_euryale.AAC.5
MPRRRDTGVPASLRGQVRRRRLTKTPHSGEPAWAGPPPPPYNDPTLRLTTTPHSGLHVDGLGLTSCLFIDPLVEIVSYPAEHNEVFDGMQDGDQGHVGEADLVILRLVRIQRRAPVHSSPVGAKLQLQERTGSDRSYPTSTTARCGKERKAQGSEGWPKAVPLPPQSGTTVPAGSALHSGRPRALRPATMRASGGGILGHWVVAGWQLPSCLACPTEGKGSVLAGCCSPDQLGGNRHPLGHRPQLVTAGVKQKKPARQHGMPASDVLLPSHGAEAPVCRSPHQHVGRHPWEGTLPTA